MNLLLINTLKVLARCSAFLKGTTRFINENKGGVSIYNRGATKKCPDQYKKS